MHWCDLSQAPPPWDSNLGSASMKGRQLLTELSLLTWFINFMKKEALKRDIQHPINRVVDCFMHVCTQELPRYCPGRM